ncbi:MAG: TPM domain-containing protein [Rhodanobacter sp.]
MVRIRRLFANLFGSWFQLPRRFSPAVLDAMAAAIAAGERSHLGEIRLAVESRLPALKVMRGLDAPTRARQVFGQLRVWDTELNTGVLIYVLVAEQRIEVVADRGISAKVATEAWEAICMRMRTFYAADEWLAGSLAAIAAANDLLVQHFPGEGQSNPDELPDRPVVL